MLTKRSASKSTASPGAIATEVKTKKKRAPSDVSAKPVNQLECWVSKLISSTFQFNFTGNDTSGAAIFSKHVIGEPTVYPQHGDFVGAWASGDCKRPHYIEVEFPMELYITKISIYETYNPGTVTGIGAWNPLTNSYISIYSATPIVIRRSRIFEPNFEPINFKCNRLRVDFDCRAAGSWCEIDAIKICGTEHRISPPPSNSLSNDMATLVNSNLYSDIIFIVEKQQVYAHKAILVTRSDYFRAMFSHNKKESEMQEIVLPDDVARNTFLAMLEFLYTGELNCNPVITVDLLKLADMFSLEDLKLNCMSRIPEHLSVDTVLTVLSAVAEGDSLAIIRDLCYEFIAMNYVEVTKSEQFHSLPKEQILEIVQVTAPKMKI